MRLKLVPDQTSYDFFRYWKVTFGASILAMILSLALFFVQGLNLGIDFLGGTTIRTESARPVDIPLRRRN